MTENPFALRFDGTNLVPSNRLVGKRMREHFEVGRIYKITEEKERWPDTHRHFFATVRDAWLTLPEDVMARYPSPEALRKKMLIQCGYCDERAVVCGSPEDAKRVAAFIAPMDDFAVVLATANVVQVFTAKSQALKAMDNRQWLDSKNAVLESIDDLLGLERGTIAKWNKEKAGD